MKIFEATKDVNLFGMINIKKNDKISIDSNYRLTHNDRVYDSPINEIGLELVGLIYSLKETRKLKLKLLGIRN